MTKLKLKLQTLKLITKTLYIQVQEIRPNLYSRQNNFLGLKSVSFHSLYLEIQFIKCLYLGKTILYLLLGINFPTSVLPRHLLKITSFHIYIILLDFIDT